MLVQGRLVGGVLGAPEKACSTEAGAKGPFIFPICAVRPRGQEHTSATPIGWTDHIWTFRELLTAMFGNSSSTFPTQYPRMYPCASVPQPPMSAAPFSRKGHIARGRRAPTHLQQRGTRVPAADSGHAVGERSPHNQPRPAPGDHGGFGRVTLGFYAVHVLRSTVVQNSLHAYSHFYMTLYRFPAAVLAPR
jgi:hypothetical protein